MMERINIENEIPRFKENILIGKYLFYDMMIYDIYLRPVYLTLVLNIGSML